MKPTNRIWIQRGAAILAALAVTGLLALLLHSRKTAQNRESSAEIIFASMSTMVSAQLYHPDMQYDFAPAFRAVQREFEKAAAICNFFDSQSELARLNRTAGQEAFVCSADLWELLQACREYYRKTGGAFDVTISPLMELWGFYRKKNAVPSPEEIQNALAKVGMDKIEFNDSAHSVRFTVPGMAINLGGIAKGWTLDRTRRMLDREFGIRKGFLNAGGNVLVFGGEFTGGIRNPFESGKICGKVKLSGISAIATSGAYERFTVIGGKEYGHIMDARTGKPANRFFSATVIADSGLASDALSTSFYLCGAGLQKEFPEVSILLIGRQEKHPELLQIHQSGNCYLELDLPEQVPHGKAAE